VSRITSRFVAQEPSACDYPIDVAIGQTQHAGLVNGVLAQVRGISREDAEDAVQDAWIVLAEKAHRLEPGPVGGYLLRTARFKALKIRDRRRAATSLDALTDIAGDRLDVLGSAGVVSPESHTELAELADDPIAGQALAAAKQGAAGQVAPRGMNHRCARYTDAQVAEVRQLRARGLTYRRIETLSGVPANYCSMLVRRAVRVTETTQGWNADMVLDAIRRFHQRTGRAPRFRDAEGNPTMPSPNTARRHFGTWREAVRAAGLEPAYGTRRVQAWTQEEMVQAFCTWRMRRKRWPSRADMQNDLTLPSPATTRRHFGTQNPRRLAEAVLTLLA
jgi:DNA-directed RNA polymerase specialized sigma24 family protein